MLGFFNTTYVPEFATFQDQQQWYREVYLKTEHWQKVKRRKLAQIHKCLIYPCDEVLNLDVHHRWYKDKDGNSILFTEKLSDLVVLCRSHHDDVHKNKIDLWLYL